MQSCIKRKIPYTGSFEHPLVIWWFSQTRVERPTASPSIFFLGKPLGTTPGLKVTFQGRITYPTKREKENHRLKSAIFGGYVSSLDGKLLVGYRYQSKSAQVGYR